MITITEIQQIINHCMRLLSCTESLRQEIAVKETYTFAEDIFKSIRKLFIAAMMYNKTLICVSGLQGAGKTTLMKNFYGIDDKYLNPTRGRGERIPIFITEKEDIDTPSMYAIKINRDSNNKYCVQNIKMSTNEFINASKGEDSKIMYLELFVPYKHTFSEGISFVLLPGFEKKNDYWNNLIEFAVNSSDSAVFVFNETSFSNSENDRYLSRIESKFGKNLVYAITGSDGSPDDNAEVRQTCIKVLNIPGNETNRVVCVGQYANDEKNKIWIDSFKKALEQYIYKETQQFQRNNKYLYDEILKIKDNLYQILNILNEDNSIEIKEYQDNKLLKEFDKAVKKKRREFEKNLDIEFEKAKNESGKNLEEQFPSNSKTLKRLFGGNSVKAFIHTREMIQKSLQYDGNKYLPNKYLGLALKRSLNALDQPEYRTNLSQLIDVKKENNKTLLLLNKNTSHMFEDVHNLLTDSTQNKVNYELRTTNNSKKLMGAVVEIGTYWYSLMSYNKLSKSIGLTYYEPSQTQLISDNVIDGAKSSKNFVAGIAGIMGIDLIGDGTINIISQIATSLSVPIPVAGAAAIAIIGAGATSVIMKDVNRMQREDFQSAKLTINSIYDNFKINILETYDIYMGRIRDRIEDNISEFSREHQKEIIEYNAKVEINNTLNLLDKISEEYAENVYGLESAFS